MSDHVVLDRQKLEIAFSEIEAVRKVLPAAALTALAQEVVQRVAQNLAVALPAHILPTPEEIDALAEALLSEDGDAAITLIERAQRKGARYEDLCQAYLAVASQRLGEWWDKDLVSFYKVTTAAGRIYAILRILRLQRLAPLPDLKRAAIFALVPGEDHTLGVTIAADMARDQGWDIELFLGRTLEELAGELATRDSGLICLAASTKRSRPALIQLIVALRISNPGARILVCGQIVARDLHLAGLTGADACAADFDSALVEMDRLLNLAASGQA